MKGESYQSSSFDIANEFPFTLKDTYADSDLKSPTVATVSGLKMGMTKWVDADIGAYTGKLIGPVLLFSPAIVSLVCNRSGSTLAQGASTKWYTLASITASAGSLTTLTHVAKFIANEEIGNLLYILDNNDSAGAAPEGQMRKIVKNTANVLTVQPAFTVAVAASDTAVIYSRTQVVASAIGDSRLETAGIVLSPDGIPDNYWGWVCRKGIVAALIKASTAITALKALIADTGRLNLSSSSVYGLTVAHAFAACSNDIVSDLIPVDFDCWSPQAITN